MWNPRAEWLDGKLCEKGFMKERYDEVSHELVRTFTEKGRNQVRKLLSEPEWRKWLVQEMKKLNIPLGLKRAIWLKLFRFLKNEKN